MVVALASFLGHSIGNLVTLVTGMGLDVLKDGRTRVPAQCIVELLDQVLICDRKAPGVDKAVVSPLGQVSAYAVDGILAVGEDDHPTRLESSSPGSLDERRELGTVVGLLIPFQRAGLDEVVQLRIWTPDRPASLCPRFTVAEARAASGPPDKKKI